jgi:hypothetical protein
VKRRRTGPHNDAAERDATIRRVNRLRALLDRWLGKSQPMDKARITEKLAAIHAERHKIAQDAAKSRWQWARSDESKRRHIRKVERHSGQTFLPPPMSEMAYVHQITSRKRTRREQAAAMLQGRHLSEDAALALLWQLRHRNAGYRMSALEALRDSTISSELAGALLVGWLEHEKPELRNVAEQVLREVNITGDALKYINKELPYREL